MAAGEGCRLTCRTEMTELGSKPDDKGWDGQRHMEGRAERCWHRRMVYDFLKQMCSFLKSFAACLPWLPLLIRHPDSPIIICTVYFSNQMVLACTLKENDIKNIREKKSLCRLKAKLRYFKNWNIWNYNLPTCNHKNYRF